MRYREDERRCYVPRWRGSKDKGNKIGFKRRQRRDRRGHVAGKSRRENEIVREGGEGEKDEG